MPLRLEPKATTASIEVLLRSGTQIQIEGEAALRAVEPLLRGLRTAIRQERRFADGYDWTALNNISGTDTAFGRRCKQGWIDILSVQCFYFQPRMRRGGTDSPTVIEVKMYKIQVSAVAVLILAGAFAASVSDARADDVVDLSGKNFTEAELLSEFDESTSGGEPDSRSVVRQASPKKLSMSQITFQTGSDLLSQRAMSFLDVLGRALGSDRLKGSQFLIEGHTDASGSKEFNMRLSKRRAESVKRYLVEQHHIEPERLLTVGKGPTELLDKASPRSDRNRRVVVGRTAGGN